MCVLWDVMCVCVQYEKERTKRTTSRKQKVPGIYMYVHGVEDHSVAVEIKLKINSQILIIDINIKVAFFNKFKFKNNQRECFFKIRRFTDHLRGYYLKEKNFICT